MLGKSWRLGRHLTSERCDSSPTLTRSLSATIIASALAYTIFTMHGYGLSRLCFVLNTARLSTVEGLVNEPENTVDGDLL